MTSHSAIALTGFIAWTLLLPGAIAAGQATVTDPLAYLLLGARAVQSLVDVASGSAVACSIRFAAFAVQVGIGVYWAFRLLVLALA